MLKAFALSLNISYAQCFKIKMLVSFNCQKTELRYKYNISYCFYIKL